MFRLTVDDVFSIRGRGTVVTGKVEEGTLRVGDELLINRHKKVRVDGIEAFRKVLESAEQGQMVGVLFRKLDRSEVGPGDLLTDAASGADAMPPPTPDEAVPPPAPDEMVPTPGPDLTVVPPPPDLTDSPVPDLTEVPPAPDLTVVPPAPAPSARDPRFAETEAQLTQFRSMKQAGLMDDAQMEDALRGMIFSAAGRQWTLHPNGSWSSSSDGREWRSDSPPG